MDALVLTHDRLRTGLRRASLDPARVADAQGAMVWLVPVPSLPALAEGGLRLLRPKNPRAALASRLLGHDGVAAIDGGYGSAGKLLHAVRTLLVRAADTPRGVRVFVIGVAPDLFVELWAKAVEELAPSEATLPRSQRAAASAQTRALAEALDSSSDPRHAEASRRLVGVALEMRLAREMVLRAADVDAPVLVVGETGTGKEAVSRAIHDLGKRRAGPFITVNCAAIPRELLESELFGHEAGSFTGATRRRTGMWPMATGGTLMLDEIGELPLDQQGKILRAVEDNEVRAVGAERAVKVDTRIVAATHRNLHEMVRTGAFREDLYYRLRGILVRTPALREHPEDIPALANHFWRKRIRVDPTASLPDEVLAELATYPWPGNARELRAVLTHLNALFANEPLRIRHVRMVMYLEGHVMGAPSPRASEALAWVDRLRHLRFVDDAVRACRNAVAPATQGGLGAASPSPLLVTEVRHLAEQRQLLGKPALVDALTAFVAQLEEPPSPTPTARRDAWRTRWAPAIDRVLREVDLQVREILGGAEG